MLVWASAQLIAVVRRCYAVGSDGSGRPSCGAGRRQLLVGGGRCGLRGLNRFSPSPTSRRLGAARATCGARSRSRLPQQAAGEWKCARSIPAGLVMQPLFKLAREWYDAPQGGRSRWGAAATPFGFAEQCNAVDAFGPEPVRVSFAPAGLGATDCCRWAVAHPMPCK
jgi:hypothetical protein